MAKSAEELRAEIADNRAQLSNTMDAIGDRVSPGRMFERKKNRTVQGVRSLKERVMGTVDDVGHAVVDAAHGAVDKAHDKTEGVHNMPETIRIQSRGNPMVAGGIAFGIGFLTAVALPPSRTEREATSAVMDKSAPLKDELTKAAHEVVEDLKDPAQQALAEVKSAANDAATHVADVAKDSVHQTADQAATMASDLRNS
jgi:hypothetical protein